MHSYAKCAALAAAGFVAAFAAGGAMAQQLNPGISCLEGEVAAADWAELSSKYKESIWDTKAAVRLQSQDDQLELTVTDTYGNNVCEQTADTKTRCKFNFPASYSGIFNIRVDNKVWVTSQYKLCAE